MAHGNVNPLETALGSETGSGDYSVAARAAELHARITQWLHGYVAKPHPELGRDGPVCPFVQPSLRDRGLDITVSCAGSKPSAESLERIIRRLLRAFQRRPWHGTNPQLHALVTVIADLTEEQLPLLDRAHAAVKFEAVGQGLMIGQFHSRCEEPAARNPSFAVSVSPVPLIAVRRMALHDILFLHGRADWFEEYVIRFGHRYRRSAKPVDSIFAALFDRAMRTFPEVAASAAKRAETPQDSGEDLNPIQANRHRW